MSTDESLKQLQIFRKKTMLLCGDFWKIFPVIPYGTKEDIVAACICNSYLLKYCTMFMLRTNIRLQNSMLDDAEKTTQTQFKNAYLT